MLISNRLKKVLNRSKWCSKIKINLIDSNKSRMIIAVKTINNYSQVQRKSFIDTTISIIYRPADLKTKMKL